MYLFLDFEASSLSKASYPVEVGWVHEDGKGESHLIKPAPGWTEWDDDAAAVHGITRQQLLREGEPHEIVCASLISLAEDHTLVASAPSWDGHWLSMLLRASGRPRHLIRLADTEDAFLAAARQRGEDEDSILAIVSVARTTLETEPPAHRALADARREWSIWRAIIEGA
jgi:hypothetical protein